jgi:hypothetical protein
MQDITTKPERTYLTEMFPIVGSHIKRIGVIRTAAGGLPMYLCIPMLVTFHLSVAVILYQWLLRPIFGLTRVRWSDHIIIDRHRVTGLSAFDVVNCWFCGYANGLCTMINTELDNLSRFQGRLGGGRSILATVVLCINVPVFVFGDLFGIRFLYDILVSRPLGMHRVSYAEAAAVLERDQYGAQFPPVFRALLLYAKSMFLRFAMALEQIESSWCPLRHFETRKGIVYPDHHQKFFGPAEVEEMRAQLSNVGTVSPRKPLY